MGKLVTASPKQSQHTPAPPTKRHGNKKRHAMPTLPMPTAAAPVPVAAPAVGQDLFDVELVTITPPAVPRSFRERFRLNRRKLIGLALVAGALGVAVGYAAALWFR